MEIKDGSKIINIEGTVIQCKVSINKRVKYIRLKINLEGLTITTPNKLTNENLQKIILEKKHWILKNYLKFKETKAASRWREEKIIYYKGRSYQVVISSYEKAKTKIILNGEDFQIYVNTETFNEDVSKEIEEEIKKWYREEARKVITAKAEYYSKLMGVKYNRISIKEQKTRWGSCSSKGNLNFNWKLLMAGEDIIDYIIVHELCHLIHLNHSKNFWKEVSLYIPEYKKLNKWLKENGKNLYI